MASTEQERAGLTARQLSVRRGRRVVVSGLDLSLPRGESVGIIGPNGGGKTSLLLGLRGLLPTDGTLRLADVDPRTVSRVEVARRVAVVPQRNEFAFPLLVSEMVLLGRAPYRRPWQRWSGEDRRVAGGWIDRMGLGPLIDRRVDELSGGERRRVFLARALVQETPFLFLDEPLAGLDPAAQEELGGLLEEIRESRERTMVLVLHDITRVFRLCDRVIGLADGAVRFAGTAEQVLDAASLESLFGVPWQVATREDGEQLLVPRPGATP
jgi:iron complex transport system ATP-binding protein